VRIEKFEFKEGIFLTPAPGIREFEIGAAGLDMI